MLHRKISNGILEDWAAKMNGNFNKEAGILPAEYSLFAKTGIDHLIKILSFE